jgi:hypothetical protein
VGEHSRFAVDSCGPEAALGLAGLIWPCYQEAFGDFGDIATWQADLFARHAGRDVCRLVGTGLHV